MGLNQHDVFELGRFGPVNWLSEKSIYFAVKQELLLQQETQGEHILGTLEYTKYKILSVLTLSTIGRNVHNVLVYHWNTWYLL